MDNSPGAGISTIADPSRGMSSIVRRTGSSVGAKTRMNRSSGDQHCAANLGVAVETRRTFDPSAFATMSARTSG